MIRQPGLGRIGIDAGQNWPECLPTPSPQQTLYCKKPLQENSAIVVEQVINRIADRFRLFSFDRTRCFDHIVTRTRRLLCLQSQMTDTLTNTLTDANTNKHSSHTCCPSKSFCCLSFIICCFLASAASRSRISSSWRPKKYCRKCNRSGNCYHEPVCGRRLQNKVTITLLCALCPTIRNL